MKRLSMLILSLCMALALCACGGKGNGIYTAGTYTGTAKGFGGDVTVELKVSTTKIESATITGADETATIGQAAFEELANQLVKANSAEIDGVSGATFTSTAVKAAAQSALDQAMGNTEKEKTAVTDGTYSATATSYGWTGMLSADVTFTEGKISDIKITEEHDSYTGEVCYTAFNYYIPRVIEAQSLAVDAISGATTTSNAIRSCVEQAINAAGGVATEWYTPVQKSNEVVKVEGYDVIVVGLGGSGIMSYCAAADTGASVFGIETTAKLGGQSATVYGPMAIGATCIAHDGEWANADEVYNTWIDYVGSEAKADIIKKAVYDIGSTLDYYNEKFGFSFSGVLGSFVKTEWSNLWTIYTADQGGTSWNVIGPNKTYQFDRAMATAKAMNEKNDYKLELTAVELIKDGGTVVGVKAISYDGTQYDIYGDSVILATGGYLGNAEMVNQYLDGPVNAVGYLVNDGFGINAAVDAGGTQYQMGIDPMIHILQVPNMIKNNDLTADQKAILSAFALVSGEKAVDVDGNAFVSTGNDADIKGYKYFNIYSEAQMQSYKENGLTDNFATATSHFMGQGGEFTVGTPVTDLDTILSVGEQYGDVFVGESIKELAEKIGANADNLAAVLGEDGKYYAVECIGYAYSTVGGVDVDVEMHVLRADGTAIENLYAVGTDSIAVENVEGKPYTPWGGQAQAWTFTSGYLAGQSAGAYGLSK